MSGAPVLRVCSLLPSATEIVAALGQRDRLVGRSAERDFPSAGGFDVERTVRESRRAGVPQLGCPIVAVDANAYYSRPAPRVADGVMQLAHLFHRDVAPDPQLPYHQLVDPTAGGRRRRATVSR